MGTPDTSLLSSGQTRKATLTMRRFAIVCCMVAAVAAFPEPQLQSFRDRIRNALLNSDQNPCGAGMRPTICVCPDGTSFTPGTQPPCGTSGAATCTCPNGTQFTPDIENIRNKIRDRVQG